MVANVLPPFPLGTSVPTVAAFPKYHWNVNPAVTPPTLDVVDPFGVPPTQFVLAVGVAVITGGTLKLLITIFETAETQPVGM